MFNFAHLHSEEFPVCSSIKSEQHYSNLNYKSIEQGLLYHQHKIVYSYIHLIIMIIYRFCSVAFLTYILQVANVGRLGNEASYGLVITYSTQNDHVMVQSLGCVTTQLQYRDIKSDFTNYPATNAKASSKVVMFLLLLHFAIFSVASQLAAA